MIIVLSVLISLLACLPAWAQTETFPRYRIIGPSGNIAQTTNAGQLYTIAQSSSLPPDPSGIAQSSPRFRLVGPSGNIADVDSQGRLLVSGSGSAMAVYDVRSYGAQGDGATDDTAAILRAIDAIPSTGGEVFFPPGTYLISDDLVVNKSYVKLRGAGGSMSLLKIGTLWTTAPQAGTVPAMVNFIGTSGSHISSLIIDGLGFYGANSSNANEPKCVSAVFADYVTIMNSYFQNFGHECIWPAGTPQSNNWRIIANSFIDIGTNSTSPSAITLNVSDSIVSGNFMDNILGGIGAVYHRHTIINNVLKNVKLTGIGVSGDTPGADDILIAGNTIEMTAGASSRNAIKIIYNSRGVVVANNVIRLISAASGLSFTGILLSGADLGVIVTGNAIYMDTTESLTGGNTVVAILGQVNNNTLSATIANNIIELANENTFYTAGIAATVNNASYNVNLQIEGNVVKGFSRSNSAYALDLQHSAGTFVFNIIDFVKSGGYTRLPTPNTLITDAFYDNRPLNYSYPIPAAQTITAGATIDADRCGEVKEISSAGSVITSTSNTFTAPGVANIRCRMWVCNTGANDITLDNNANFKSAGGENVVLTADDCIAVYSTGSVWRQLSPIVAN